MVDVFWWDDNSVISTFFLNERISWRNTGYVAPPQTLKEHAP